MILQQALILQMTIEIVITVNDVSHNIFSATAHFRVNRTSLHGKMTEDTVHTELF